MSRFDLFVCDGCEAEERVGSLRRPEGWSHMRSEDLCAQCTGEFKAWKAAKDATKTVEKGLPGDTEAHPFFPSGHPQIRGCTRCGSLPTDPIHVGVADV